MYGWCCKVLWLLLVLFFWFWFRFWYTKHIYECTRLFVACMAYTQIHTYTYKHRIQIEKEKNVVKYVVKNNSGCVFVFACLFVCVCTRYVWAYDFFGWNEIECWNLLRTIFVVCFLFMCASWFFLQWFSIYVETNELNSTDFVFSAFWYKFSLFKQNTPINCITRSSGSKYWFTFEWSETKDQFQNKQYNTTAHTVRIGFFSWFFLSLFYQNFQQ